MSVEKLERRLTVEERETLIREVTDNFLEKMIYKLYFEERLTQREVGSKLGISRSKVQKVFKENGWRGRHRNRVLDSDIVRELYDSGMAQLEIASKFDVSRTYVQKILKETKSGEFEDSISRRKIEIDLERLRVLYCEKGLTQTEIAEELGVAQRTISRRIEKLGFERQGRKTLINTTDLHQLYFEEQLSQRETAKRLGVSLRVIKDRFREMGWKTGPRGAILDTKRVLHLQDVEGKTRNEIAVIIGVSSTRLNRLFEDIEHDSTLTLNHEHGSNQYRIEARRLREEIFGQECTLCNANRDERMLVIHRKDGTPHDPEILWNPKSLLSLVPDDWTLLCPNCHKSVHWTMDYLSMDWDEIERALNMNIEIVPNDRVGGVKRLFPKLDNSIESIRRYRMELFGDECAACHRHSDDYKLVLHKKDGQAHHRNSTWTIEFLQNAIVDDWIMLCDRCHLVVHWFLKQGSISWDWIEQKLVENQE